jgi:hypothetical protein
MLRTTASRALGPLAAGVVLARRPAIHATGPAAGSRTSRTTSYSGDYVAAGVGLQRTGVNGFATGTLTVDPVADPRAGPNRRRLPLLADHLLQRHARSSGAPGAKFKGNDISQIAVLLEPRRAPRPAGATVGGTVSPTARGPPGRTAPTCSASSRRIRPATPDRPVQVQVTGAHTVTPPRHGEAATGLPRRSAPGWWSSTAYRLRPGARVPDREAAAPVHRPLRRRKTLDNRRLAVPVPLQGFFEASRARRRAS